MKIFFFIICISAVSFAAVERSDTHYYRELEDLKMEHRFGMGISAGGPLAVLGIEGDVNINSELSISGGLGTEPKK